MYTLSVKESADQKDLPDPLEEVRRQARAASGSLEGDYVHSVRLIKGARSYFDPFAGQVLARRFDPAIQSLNVVEVGPP